MTIRTTQATIFFIILLIILSCINLFLSGSLQLVSGLWIVLLAPGISIYSLFKPSKVGLIESFLLVLGLSISFIMLLGLVLSTSREITGLQTPLNRTPIVFFIVGFSIIAHIASFFRSVRNDLPLRIPWKKLALSCPFLLLPLLASLGAALLNSGGSSILTLMALILCPLVGVILFLASKYSSIRDLYPVYIYSFSLTLLWALSLRSPHISGYDISLEYKVFMLTKNLGFWNIEAFKSAYNACLSISVLPTVLSNLITIGNEYVFKAIFPLIFATVPVIIYKTWSQKISHIGGLLASFFFISFPWFIDPLTTLARQQIAFLFFTLLVYLVFTRKMDRVFRVFCFYVFTAALILSHYSTTYLTIAMLGIGIAISVFMYVAKLVPSIKRLFHRFPLPVFGMGPSDFTLLNPIYFIYLCVLSYVWLSVLTGTSRNIQDLLAKTASSLQSSDNNLYSGMVSEAKNLFGKKTSSNPYEDFRAQKIKEFSDKFPQISVPLNRAEISPKNPDTTPVRSVGIFITAQKIFRFLSLFIALLTPIAGIIAIIGFRIKEIEHEKWLSPIWISSYVLIGLILLVPYISIGYNFERIFMQSMLLTTLSPVLISLLLAKVLKNIKVLYAMFFIVITIFYGFNYGIVWHFTGGKPVMWLDNKGISYDLTYTHDTEIATVNFLKTYGSKENIHTSSKGRNILTAYASPKSISTETLALLVVPGSYIFSHYANVTNKLEYFTWSGTPKAFTYQSDDFDKRFNLVYSNNSSRLYK